MVGLHQLTVLIVFCIDQGNKALVLLRLFIDQLEDTSCTCKAHGDQCHLVGALSHGLGQLSGHPQERDDNSDRYRTKAPPGQVRCLEINHQAANNGKNHIHQIAHIAKDRHQGITILVCCLAVLKQLFVVF